MKSIECNSIECNYIESKILLIHQIKTIDNLGLIKSAKLKTILLQKLKKKNS